MNRLNTNQVISECRKEAKKYGLTFKAVQNVYYNGNKAYALFSRSTGQKLSMDLLLNCAYNWCCEGSFREYKEN